jgi:hypothetical protein
VPQQQLRAAWHPQVQSIPEHVAQPQFAFVISSSLVVGFGRSASGPAGCRCARVDERRIPVGGAGGLNEIAGRFEQTG